MKGGWLSNMIKIEKKLSINKIEAMYSSLGIYSKEDTVDVVIPGKIESLDFFIVPALIQFISTWLRVTKHGKLKIELDSSNDSLENFMEEPYAFPIVIMSWQRGIENNFDNNDLTSDLRKINSNIHLTMKSLKKQKGQKLLLTCFDHLSSEKGLLDCFYRDGEYIDSEGFLSIYLTESISQVLNLNRQASINSLSGVYEDLIAIIYELMKNTDEWARTDKNSKILNPNIRGLFMNFIKKNKNTLINNYKNNKGLTDYFESFQTNSVGEIYFLEISVFDSGDGFINKYNGIENRNTLNEKLGILKKCLIKHNTSAVGFRAEEKGLGLDRILSVIDGKGLLWIRTDTLSFYRNMKKNIYEGNEIDIKLFDTETHSEIKLREKKLVTGSAISIIYPITIPA